jgi:hypothetical protein
MLFVTEYFIASLNAYGKHPVSTAEESTEYLLQTSHFLKLKQHLPFYY